METTTLIPLEQLRPSPTNPRRTYVDETLAELSTSIAAQGVMQPIVVRKAPNRPNDQHNLIVTHEIVFGHRRYRAAQLAGLATIPCLVRDLTDEQAAVQQLHENLHREDVSPLEEADGYAALMQAHKVKVDDLVAKSGKSRSYIYARVRLASAAPEVRAALASEGLGSEIAQRVARIPSHRLQAEALEDLRTEEWVDGKMVPTGWVSDRSAKQMLANLFVDLEDAPFALDDAKLAARAGACTGCPHRAGNDPDLAELHPNTCLSSECYKAKCLASGIQRIAVARKAGQPVLEADDVNRLMPHRWQTAPEGYIRLDTPAFEEDDPEHPDTQRSVSLRDALARLGKKAPQPTISLHPWRPGLVIESLTEEQAKAIVAQLTGATAEGASTPSTAARAQSGAPATAWPFLLRDNVEDDATPEERALAMPAWEKVQLAMMDAACALKERTADELLLVARALLQDRCDISAAVIARMGWREELDAAADGEDFDSEEEWCMDRLARAEPWQVAEFMVLLAIAAAPARYGEHGLAEKRALAASYGVDPVAAAGLEEQTDDAGSAGGRAAQGELLEGAPA